MLIVHAEGNINYRDSDICAPYSTFALQLNNFSIIAASRDSCRNISINSPKATWPKKIDMIMRVHVYACTCIHGYHADIDTYAR